MSYNKRGFTIVELIVVISILWILSTIWFISYSWYLLGARDSNRLAQLEWLTKWLNVTLTKWRLPYPDSKIDIKSWAEIIAYQWVVWETVLERLWYSNDWLDPKDKTNFLFYTNKNRKYFQLMWFLEDQWSKIAWVFDTTYAAIDYTVRYPTVTWNKLWMLLTSTNQPLAQILLDSWSTDIDIDDVNPLTLKSYLTDDEFVTWSWTTFVKLKDVAKIGWKFYSVVSNDYVYSAPAY